MGLVGFFAEPNCGRSTVGIIWNCLATTFLCTWTMSHPDLHEASLTGRVLRFFVALIMPKAAACKALTQVVEA